MGSHQDHRPSFEESMSSTILFFVLKALEQRVAPSNQSDYLQDEGLRYPDVALLGHAMCAEHSNVFDFSMASFINCDS